MPKKSILSKTCNFFRLYHHICGKSEVPEIYHFWCCVGLLSATMEDRVWYELIKNNPLKPNLYIGLIGPGSLGKGIAISQALKLYEDSCHGKVYRGKLTFAHLIDKLGKGNDGVDEWGRDLINNPRMWLVMDELMNAVGNNRGMVDELIALMTEIYTATNYILQTGTRTTGEVTLNRPCLNWLFGSNEPWLRKVLTKDTFESGFTARTCFIYADYKNDELIPRPKYPSDYEEVYEHLKCRLWMLQGYQGRFLITPTAEAALDKWYYSRQKPHDEAMLSAWGRQREMLLRFAMVLCAADGQRMVIRVHHIQQAVKMVRQISGFTKKLMYRAVETNESRASNWIYEYLEKRKNVDVKHVDLLRWARKVKGMDAERVKKCVYALQDEGVIQIGLGETGGRLYRFLEEDGL